jgi:hypothetical protein
MRGGFRRFCGGFLELVPLPILFGLEARWEVVAARERERRADERPDSAGEPRQYPLTGRAR